MLTSASKKQGQPTNEALVGTAIAYHARFTLYSSYDSGLDVMTGDERHSISSQAAISAHTTSE